MLLQRGIVSDNDEYLFPVSEDFTREDLRSFINYHKTNYEQLYKDKMNEYKGKTKAFDEEIAQNMQDNNHLIVNFPKNLVDTLNGYFIGIPPTIKVDDQEKDKVLQSWINDNSFVDKLSEISKQSSIYGKSYMLAFNNENSQLKTATISPDQSFMIYDDTINKNPIVFVTYGKNGKDEITGTAYYSDRADSFTYIDDVVITDSQPLVFKGKVPAVEFFDNEERLGVFDSVITLIHAYDKAFSAKLDDIDYFAHAYLFLKNFDLSEDEQINIKQNRLIVTKNAGSEYDVDAKFLEKPDADGNQENILNRLTTMIYQISMIANISDDVFGSSTSGTALAYKMQAMSNLAVNKERKFTQNLREMFSVLGVQLPYGEPMDITFRFTRNIPNNVAEEAETAKNMIGVTSLETALSTLSVVDDPKAELTRIQEEQNEQIRNAVNNNPATDYGFNDSTTSEQGE